jgi:hypothetical protein
MSPAAQTKARAGKGKQGSSTTGPYGVRLQTPASTSRAHDRIVQARSYVNDLKNAGYSRDAIRTLLLQGGQAQTGTKLVNQLTGKIVNGQPERKVVRVPVTTKEPTVDALYLDAALELAYGNGLSPDVVQRLHKAGLMVGRLGLPLSKPRRRRAPLAPRAPHGESVADLQWPGSSAPPAPPPQPSPSRCAPRRRPHRPSRSRFGRPRRRSPPTRATTTGWPATRRSRTSAPDAQDISARSHRIPYPGIPGYAPTQHERDQAYAAYVQAQARAEVAARRKRQAKPHGHGPSLNPLAVIHLPSAYVKALAHPNFGGMGVVSGAAGVAGRAAKDAEEMAVTLPSSVAHLASTAVHHPEKVPGELLAPYKQLAKHPVKSLSEHPLQTALMVAPAVRMPGRVARQGAAHHGQADAHAPRSGHAGHGVQGHSHRLP